MIMHNFDDIKDNCNIYRDWLRLTDIKTKYADNTKILNVLVHIFNFMYSQPCAGYNQADKFVFDAVNIIESKKLADKPNLTEAKIIKIIELRQTMKYIKELKLNIKAIKSF